jgi:hypothetical protein
MPYTSCLRCRKLNPVPEQSASGLGCLTYPPLFPGNLVNEAVKIGSANLTSLPYERRPYIRRPCT